MLVGVMYGWTSMGETSGFRFSTCDQQRRHGVRFRWLLAVIFIQSANEMIRLIYAGALRRAF